MAWRWQLDHLWSSCEAQARSAAEAWRDAPPHASLKQLAAQQPLVEVSEDMLQQIAQHASALAQHADCLIVVGTGGASLGAQTLCALADQPEKVQFWENCDPVTAQRYFAKDKARTAWLVVSKSGETVETLAAAASLIGHYGDAALLRRQVRVITSTGDSALKRLSVQHGLEILDHPPRLGGRFSVFSCVGLVPAVYAGLDAAAIVRAAKDAFAQYHDAIDTEFWAQAAWFAANMKDKPVHLLMAYADRLRPATQWYKQLWAESLGKAGKGPTPVTAIGAIDQHSQLQLYLDGPRDKLATLWLPDMAGMGTAIPDVKVAGFEYLAGHRMGEVMQATAEATVTTLALKQVPLRVLRGALTPESLAFWMARQMLETLAVAALIGVDPYSQPAVEEGKKLTRAALAKAAV